MATSSMHKPGWRSRRRSRLSLVERAVPRLGRVPETDESNRAEGAGGPSEETPSNAGTRLPLTPAAAATSKPANGSAGASALPAVGAGDVPMPPVAAPASDTAIEIVFRAEQATAREGVETPATLPDAETPETSGPEAPAPGVENLPDGRDAVLADMAAAPDPSSEQVNARTAAQKETGEHETSFDLPIVPAGLPLALDWDRLVESGFVDPRDRGRPLSKSMDEIVRALIRQALSDQSSWRDRVILVTSPTERKSKTSAAINFAFGLTTIADHRAVIVDVDTLGEGAVDRLGGGDRVGITAALADESITVEDLAIGTDLDRLTLVASGAHDEETLDRFASRRMLEILRRLTEDPETILIIDAPPILLSQEAAVLSVVAGQVVMSVEAGRTTGDQIEHALQRIGERHNVSLVLNESSGVIESDASTASGKSDALSANRRAPGNKRRLPSAVAAATSAGMLGLLGMQAGGQADLMRSAVPVPADHAISAPAVSPSERWSIDPDSMMTSCRRDCR